MELHFKELEADVRRQGHRRSSGDWGWERSQLCGDTSRSLSGAHHTNSRMVVALFAPLGSLLSWGLLQTFTYWNDISHVPLFLRGKEALDCFVGSAVFPASRISRASNEIGSLGSCLRLRSTCSLTLTSSPGTLARGLGPPPEARASQWSIEAGEERIS